MPFIFLLLLVTFINMFFLIFVNIKFIFYQLLSSNFSIIYVLIFIYVISFLFVISKIIIIFLLSIY